LPKGGGKGEVLFGEMTIARHYLYSYKRLFDCIWVVP